MRATAKLSCSARPCLLCRRDASTRARSRQGNKAPARRRDDGVASRQQRDALPLPVVLVCNGPSAAPGPTPTPTLTLSLVSIPKENKRGHVTKPVRVSIG